MINMVRSTCSHCNLPINEEDLLEFNHSFYHIHCLEQISFVCDHCHTRIHNTTRCEIQEHQYCDNCFNHITCRCCSCNERIYLEDSFQDSDGDHYCPDCYDDQEVNSDDSDCSVSCCHLKTHPKVHPHVSRMWNSRKKIKTFGIELETNSNFDEPKYFSKVTDGSISGREYVSYVLPYNDIGFAVVNDFEKVAKENHARVNNDCGYHVHLGGYRNSYSNIKKVWLGYLIMENMFFSTMPQSRRQNSYCLRFSKDYTKESILRQNNLPRLLSHFYEKQIRLKKSTPKDSYHFKRYYYVNLHVWLSRQTIEYRLHSGTTNAKKILAWAEINKKFTDWLTSKSTSIPDVLALTEWKFYTIVGKKLENYILKRIDKFGRAKHEVINIKGD